MTLNVPFPYLPPADGALLMDVVVSHMLASIDL